MSIHPSLFDSANLGYLKLSNRIVMAPMTRSRANHQAVPADLAIQYYSQRSNASLIIAEGTAPSPNGLGYPRTPAIYTPEQMQAWRKITDAVHQNGGKIFLQLMYVGRIAHPLNKAPFNTPDSSTFYTPGAKGYIDYPVLAAE